jgi:hypothetical protein
LSAAFACARLRPASSTAEDISRGIDFLYSRNRLNVAISRAKCLAKKVNPLTYLTYVLGNVRNKRVALLTPDEFTVSNIAHVG